MRVYIRGLVKLVLFSTTIIGLNCQYDNVKPQTRSSNFTRKFEFVDLWPFRGHDHWDVQNPHPIRNTMTPEKLRILDFAIYNAQWFTQCYCDDTCSLDDAIMAYASVGRRFLLRQFRPFHYLTLCVKYDSYRNYGICKCYDLQTGILLSPESYSLKDPHEEPRMETVTAYFPALGIVSIPGPTNTTCKLNDNTKFHLCTAVGQRVIS